MFPTVTKDVFTHMIFMEYTTDCELGIVNIDKSFKIIALHLNEGLYLK